MPQMLVASNNKQNQVSLVDTHMLLGMQKLPKKSTQNCATYASANKSVYVHHYGLCVHVPHSLLKASVVVPSF
jgi:hypothetical protein